MDCFLQNRETDNSQNHILWVHAIVVQRLFRLHHESAVDEFDALDRVDRVLLFQPFLDHHNDAADQRVWRERQLEFLLLVRECLGLEQPANRTVCSRKW